MNSTLFNNVCAVRITKSSTDSKQVDGTGSGILIDSKQGLVLTHASVINPFVPFIRPTKWNNFRQTGILTKDGLSEKLKVQVFLPTSSASDERDMVSTRYNPSLLNCNLQEDIKPYQTYAATLKMVFECTHLRSVIERLVPDKTWQFVDEISPSASSQESKKKDQELDEQCYFLLPCFVLLKLKNWRPVESRLQIRSSLDNRQGDTVELCATPFGALSPDVFLNSRSRGIISNLAGVRQVLILTDARCIPGCDGGAMFYCQKGNRVLTGIIMASLCWKNNEWVGLSLACAISEVLGSLRGYFTKSPIVLDVSSDLTPTYGAASLLSVGKSLVPLLSCGGSWGSGIVFDGKQGTILTCSHVIKGSKFTKVLVHDLPDGEKVHADVVYRNPTHDQFDVALIQVPTSATANKPHLKLATIAEGETVYVIGHGLFGAEHNLSPSVTMGIVSKVISFGKVLVMIQTTCAVHAGASGGAVLNKYGHLVGIVVCNSKDTVSGASYPHVNMCVPMATIGPVLKAYLATGDKDILSNLHVKNERVQQIWSIGTQESSTVLSRL